MSLHQFLMILVMMFTVLLLRGFPFIVFGGGKKKIPPFLTYLGKFMTGAAIAMLAVYSMFGVMNYSSFSFGRLKWVLLASFTTVVLHLAFKNPLVSIIGSTALYMFLIQL